jgi:hypothetical protein
VLGLRVGCVDGEELGCGTLAQYASIFAAPPAVVARLVCPATFGHVIWWNYYAADSAALLLM